MEDTNVDRIRTLLNTLLNDVDKEFHGLNHYHQAKFAIEQISIWQQKFDDAKGKILKDDIVDATVTSKIGQFPIEAQVE